MCDTEYFKDCYYESDYEEYLKEFPNGKHVKEANKKIAQIKKRNRIFWIVCATLVVTIISLIVIKIINSSSRSSCGSSTTSPAYSGSYYDSDDSTDDYSSEYDGSSDEDIIDDDESSDEYKYEAEEEGDDDYYSQSQSQEPSEYDLYIDNYLSTGSLPYRSVYGRNKSYDDYTEHSEMRITGPSNSDVVVIVKRGNSNGKVVGHAYIHHGGTVTIKMPNGTYQPFFYYGEGWNPNKDMGNGLRGGFVSDEYVSKDDPQRLYNDILTYSLVLQSNGNFQTKGSSKNEAF